MVGAVGNAPEATTPVSGGQHNSFNNIRRQTSLPKGAQATALSTAAGRDDLTGLSAAPASQPEPLSAGLHLSANPLRGIGQSGGEPRTEQEKNSSKVNGGDGRQQFNGD
jgi:hypothetical protein